MAWWQWVCFAALFAVVLQVRRRLIARRTRDEISRGLPASGPASVRRRLDDGTWERWRSGSLTVGTTAWEFVGRWGGESLVLARPEVSYERRLSGWELLRLDADLRMLGVRDGEEVVVEIAVFDELATGAMGIAEIHDGSPSEKRDA
jgi:hypothetical protein